MHSQHQRKMAEEQVRGDFYKFKSINADESPMFKYLAFSVMAFSPLHPWPTTDKMLFMWRFSQFSSTLIQLTNYLTNRFITN